MKNVYLLRRGRVVVCHQEVLYCLELNYQRNGE